MISFLHFEDADICQCIILKKNINFILSLFLISIDSRIIRNETLVVCSIDVFMCPTTKSKSLEYIVLN